MSSTSTQNEEVLSLFRRAVWDVAQKKIDDVKLESKISALGVDSVAMLEVVGIFEEELSIHLPDEKLARVQTVGDLVDLVQRLRPAA